MTMSAVGVCMEPCGGDATKTQFGATVSAASNGVGDRVIVVGAPKDDGCGNGLHTTFVGGMDGCTDRGGVYLFEWDTLMTAYVGVAVYKGMAMNGRLGSAVSARRLAAGGVLVGAGSPRDDNNDLDGKVVSYTTGGVAGGAGHMLRRVAGRGTAWSVVHTAKPMHPYNVGHDAEMGSSVDVDVEPMGSTVRGYYCARGDGNGRSGEHPASYVAGEAGSGALFIVREP